MNIHFSYFSNSSLSFPKILPSLTAQQKKIILIASIALVVGCVIINTLNRYCFKLLKNPEKLSNQKNHPVIEKVESSTEIKSLDSNSFSAEQKKIGKISTSFVHPSPFHGNSILHGEKEIESSLITKEVIALSYDDLLPELKTHILQFLSIHEIGKMCQLSIHEIGKMCQLSKKININAKTYLDSFEGQLRTFYYLASKDEDKQGRTAAFGNRSRKYYKRKDHFTFLLESPNLKKYLEIKENSNLFFNHVGLKDYDSGILLTNFKTLHDYYFAFAGDQELHLFVNSIINLEYDHSINDSSAAFNFLASLKKSHLQCLMKWKEIDLKKFLHIFTFHASKKPDSLFILEMIFDFYQLNPNIIIWQTISKNHGLTNWDNLQCFVIAARIFHKFDTFSDDQSMGQWILTMLKLKQLNHCTYLDWKNCFEALVPKKLLLIKEEHQKTFMQAIFNYDRQICYEYLMLVLETKNQAFISTCLKEFLVLNQGAEDPEIGLSCVVEAIVIKEQAIALIQTIQSFTEEQQNRYFYELYHRIELLKEDFINFSFGRYTELYEEWNVAFQECGIEFESYKTNTEQV